MNPFDVLSLCAEIAVAILGFSGVVVVFGGRSQGSTGQPLFRTMFRGTLIPLALIALAFILDAASLAEITTWRICSAVHAVATSLVLYGTLRVAWPTTWALRLVRVGGVLVLFLSLLNALVLHAFWPVLAIVIWALGVSLYAFSRLIFSSAQD